MCDPAGRTDEVAGEWEHFLYVGKLAFSGWALHYCEFIVSVFGGTR